MNGVDLFNLALFWLVRPKTYIDKVQANSQIARAEDRLGLSRKKGSTTSNKAHSDANLQQRFLYRNAAFPDGVLGESTCDIIDLDESKFRIKDQNQNFGKVVREKQCDTMGNYINGCRVLTC